MQQKLSKIAATFKIAACPLWAAVSNPSSHSVTDQRMRFRDVMFDVGYQAKTGVWGEWSNFNKPKVFARLSCFQGVPYSEGNSGRGFLHT